MLQLEKFYNRSLTVLLLVKPKVPLLMLLKKANVSRIQSFCLLPRSFCSLLPKSDYLQRKITVFVSEEISMSVFGGTCFSIIINIIIISKFHIIVIIIIYIIIIIFHFIIQCRNPLISSCD